MSAYKKSIPAAILAGFFWGMSLLVAAGCSNHVDGTTPSCQESKDQHEHMADTGHEDPGHNHDHGEASSGEIMSMSLDELAQVMCEHNMPAYECTSCRYEVGVVKVPAALLKEDAAADGGLIRSQPVATVAVTNDMNVTGEVQLNENTAVKISPRISGIVESVRVDIGAHVMKGDVLFTVNSSELGRALVDYERSRALTALSATNFEREKSLFNRKIASAQDMIEAQMVYEQHKTELKASEQALHVLGLSEEDLEPMIKDKKCVGTISLPVRAPIEGTIVEKHALVGEFLEPGSMVMLLADLTTVWVWANIYEQDLSQHIEARKQGPLPAQAFVRAFPETPFPGRIDYIGVTMEEQTRTVKVRATVENKNRRLRPGMFCDLRIGITKGEEALAIPRSALLSDEGKDFVFKHWQGDLYVRRPVTTGREFFDKVEILEGLAPREIIVAEGGFLLKSDILREKMGAGCAD